MKIIAKRLPKYFKVCPACQQNFKEHRFAYLALTIMAERNKDRVEKFLSSIREHKWKEVLSFDEFDKFDDTLAFQVIRCPFGRAVWVITREPYSLDDPYLIAESEVLNSTESQILLDLITEEKWAELA